MDTPAIKRLQEQLTYAVAQNITPTITIPDMKAVLGELKWIDEHFEQVKKIQAKAVSTPDLNLHDSLHTHHKKAK